MNPRDIRGIEDVYELSPLQQGMLFHSLRHPRSGVYVEQLDATLAGDLDPEALASAWQEVVDRHPVLRTSFHWQEIDKPLQVVHRNVQVRLERLDWSLLPPERLARDLAARQRFERERGFDLSQAPLLRLALIRQPDGTHRLLWTYHHLLLDGWSLSLVLEEVFALYGARRRGEAARLPPRPPYSAYVRWLQGRDPAAAEAFWRRTLAGLQEPTPLPLARAASGELEEGWHGEREVRLTAADTESLGAFARRRGLTLNTVLHGAWALLLSRYTGRQDVVFGSVMSGRPPDLPGAEVMLGLFINTLPVRVEVAPERELVPWLQELQTRQAEAREHGHAGLSDLRRWSELPPGAPLFETLLVFENFPAGAVAGFATEGLEVREVRFQERSDIPLVLESGPERELYLRTGHDRRRFDDAEIDRLLGHLRNLLEGLTAASSLEEVPLLSSSEQRQLLAEGNGTAVAWPPAASVVELFEVQTERTPEAVAVADREEHLTYRDLDERSGRLAARLATAGVGPETVVGLLGRRGAGFLAAVLGVFKAGGAYLPLDPRHPPARWARMLVRAGCPVVLVSHEHRAGLEEALATIRPGGPQRLGLEEALAGATPGDAPRPVRDPRHLAYVIFTSGSTGEPKGALLEQGGLLNHLRSKVSDLGLGSGDAVAQTAAPSFDMSVWQLLAPLLVGARVEVFEDEVAFDGNRLLPEAARRGVTVLDVVPSLLRAMSEAAEAAGQPELPDLRWVVTGGEALPPAVARAWLARFPRVPLVNAYGPTECTDTVAQLVLRQAPREGEARVPIGRPLPNLRLAVLDRGMRLVPPGAAGELCVGGPAVARGYLGDPAATARAFVPDPFAASPGERLYRTGDLARRRSGGELEILGRLDHQVKVRGYRIEPGEVEAALRRRPEVADGAVVARESAAGPRLVAYVVWRDGAPPDAAALAERLTAALRQELPDPLVPSAFVTLEALPLTANGKLDRAALPAPEVRPGAGYVAPRSPIEERLARLFAEILGAEGRAGRVGVHDDFFALGGHSLLAMRLAARVSSEWEVPLTLPDLFARPTVAGIGLHIAESRLREAAAGEAAALLDEVRGLSDEELDELLRQESAAVEEGR